MYFSGMSIQIMEYRSVKLFMARKDADWVIDNNSPAGPPSPIEQIYGDNHHSFLTFGIFREEFLEF